MSRTSLTDRLREMSKSSKEGKQSMLQMSNGIVDVDLMQNDVRIDGGKVSVRKEGIDNYYINASGFSTIETSSKTVDNSYRKDPHYYYNGNNGLTIRESVERALSEIDRMLAREYLLPVQDEARDYLRNAVTKKITDGEGRYGVYKLAGGIIKGYRDGFYLGVPFEVIFSAFVHGRMKDDSLVR